MPAYKYNALLSPPRTHLLLLSLALSLAWSVGILGRGYWTPDEPREADIAWRMSWQSDKAVPLLAGEAFCEKPPLTYWVAGAAIRMFGTAAWVARLPNLLYALITALGVGLLARAGHGPARGLGRGGRDFHFPALLPGRHLARHRCAAARCGIGRLARRLSGVLRAGRGRSAARLHVDACRVGVGLPEQERRGLDGARAHARHADAVGEALARAAALGTLCGIGASSGLDSRLGVVRVPGRRRARAPEGFLLEQSGRALCARRRSPGIAVCSRTSQQSGEVFAGASHLSLALDFPRGGGGAARMARAARTGTGQPRRALRVCVHRSHVDPAFRRRDGAQRLPRTRDARIRATRRLVGGEDLSRARCLGRSRRAGHGRARAPRGTRIRHRARGSRRRRLGSRIPRGARRIRGCRGARG